MKKLLAAIATLAFAGSALATTINFDSGSAAPRHRAEKRAKKQMKRHAPQAKHHRAPVRHHR